MELLLHVEMFANFPELQSCLYEIGFPWDFL